MTRKTFFRFAWALTVLLAFGLGCQLVEEVQDVIALATDVDIEGLTTEIGGLVTDIDLEGLATDIDISSISTEMESMSTEMESMITEMGSVVTEMESLFTDIPLFDETPGPVNTPNGFPADIPVMTGAVSDMTGTPTRLEYSIDSDLNTVVDFYRREMPARGWVEQSADIQAEEARLVFQNGSRRAEVHITEDFLFGLTIEIDVQG